MWKTDVWGILLHPTQAKVWILPSAQGYRLPSFTLEYSENIFQNNHLSLFSTALNTGFETFLTPK